MRNLFLLVLLPACEPTGASTMPVSETPVPTPGERSRAWAGGDAVVALDAGESHACALFDGGGVQCWGLNENGVGQRGGSAGAVDEAAAVVPWLGTGVAQIAVTEDYSCARFDDGLVECWGNGQAGALGRILGDEAFPTPLPVNGVEGAVDLTVGGQGACAIDAVGDVLCWGSDLNGGIGQAGERPAPGSDASYKLPHRVLGLDRPATAVTSAGGGHCALLDDGGVRCWGGVLGALGIRTHAVRAPGLDAEVQAIFGSDGGEHLCALQAGRVVCLGKNDQGQLGDGTSDFRPVAVPMADAVFSSEPVSVGVGADSTCVLLADGTVWCTGDQDYGQLGNGQTSGTSVFPAQVQGLADAVAITGGHQASCALRATGDVVCWGRDALLGDGPQGDQAEPVAVQGLDTFELVEGSETNPERDAGSPWTPPALPAEDAWRWAGGSLVEELAVGAHHACVRYDGGGVRCWGDAADNRLAQPASPHLPATAVPTLVSGVSSLAVGDESACALADGTVVCWGSSLSTQLGQDTSDDPGVHPTPVQGLAPGATAVYAGAQFNCAAYATGMRCWGYNNYHQLGTGTSSFESTVSDVAGITGTPDAFDAGFALACVLQGGAVSCWGDSTTHPDGLVPTPAVVGGLETGVTDLSVGHDDNVCAVKDGAVWCFGSNDASQLGSLGTGVHPLTQLGFSGPVTHVANGDGYTCAALAAGGVECMGEAVVATETAFPETIAGLPAGALVDLDGGEAHVCGLYATGEVYCWGQDDALQTGGYVTGAVYGARRVEGLQQD